ncbi:MAG TPA: hypothetical protein VHZ55_24675, partial [Bryobacteraceae bacterium]|nr:hypothetical protein [Bryobacteraceae bacterium]
ISPWGPVFQTKLSGRCRQTTTINQYPGTDGSSRSQYSAVYITSIDGLMSPDLLTNGSDYANSLLYGVLAQHKSRRSIGLSIPRLGIGLVERCLA